MKLNLSIFTGVASLAALMSGVFADTATTDPVGYITSSLAADPAGTGADSYVAPSLVQPNLFSGVSTNDPSATTVINFASGVPIIPAGESGLYYVEIKSGTGAGWWSSLKANTATTATSVEVENTFPAGLAVGVSINLRHHNTLKTWMGANTPGLVTPDVNPAKPERVIVLDPVTQSTKTFVYSTAFYGPAGWYNEVTEALADDTIIYPGQAALVRRYTSGPKSIVHVAHVKMTPTQIDIFKGDNLIESMLATGTTLAGSAINTGNVATGLVREDYNNANGGPDRIITLSPSQVSTTYVALATNPFDFINEVTEDVVNTTPVAEGTAFILRRDPSLANGVWTAAAQFVAP